MSTRGVSARGLLALSLLVFADCSGGPPEEVIDSPADIAAVEQTVLGFFVAMKDWDYDRMRNLVTADLELVEDTVVFDVDGFLGFVASFEEAGASIEFEFADFNTEVRGNVAWTRYLNRAVMTIGEEVTHFEWLESAVFEKVDGQWKIDRLQSAPVRIEVTPAGEG